MAVGNFLGLRLQRCFKGELMVQGKIFIDL